MYEANKQFQVFFIFHFGNFSVFSVASSTPVGVLYSIPQKNTYKIIYYAWSSASLFSFQKKFGISLRQERDRHILKNVHICNHSQ